MLSHQENGFAGALSAVEIDPFGRLWTCDVLNGAIQILDRDGNELATVAGGLGSGPEQWNWSVYSPDGGSFIGCGIAFAPDGTAYVTDGGNDRIKVLDSTGALIDAWSTQAKKDSRASGPVSVTWRANGELLVIDFGPRTVARRFSPDGAYLGDFEPGGDIDASSFDPISAQEDGSGNLWLAELAENRVIKLAPDGSLLLAIGGIAAGTGPGQFKEPTDLASDDLGNIYVADNGNQRLQVFAPDGAFLAQFTGEEAGLPRFGKEGGGTASVISGGRGYLYLTDYSREDVPNGDMRLIKFHITLPDRPLAATPAP